MQMLSEALLESLLAHAEKERPNECCGAFFRDEETDQTILQPYVNMADNPEHEFLIDPVEYVHSKMIYGMAPVAFYHSHPSKGPALSLQDMRLMDALVKCKASGVMLVVGMQPTIEVRCHQWHPGGYRVLWGYMPAQRRCTIEDIKRVREALRNEPTF